MINKEKYININYVEAKKSKEWMNKNLPATGKSPFIRGAVQKEIERYEKVKLDKKKFKLANKKLGKTEL
jgi:hypothetical protein